MYIVNRRWNMANLQVRDIDNRIYEALKERAKQQHRSLSQEVVHIIEEYLSRPSIDSTKQTESFLQLVGAWQGPESAQEILTSIRKGRKESKRFRGTHGLFD